MRSIKCINKERKTNNCRLKPYYGLIDGPRRTCKYIRVHECTAVCGKLHRLGHTTKYGQITKNQNFP